MAAALKGRKVVRLKSGDPAIFGLATEELEAAKAPGVTIDLVPGITAVSAAGAALGRSLTQRSVTDTLVFATGSGCSDTPLPQSARLSGPGTTTAFYMSVGQAGRPARSLMDLGLPSHSPVDLCANISKHDEQLIRATVRDLPSAVVRYGIKSGAIILVRWPRHQPAAQSTTPRVAHGPIAREMAN